MDGITIMIRELMLFTSSILVSFAIIYLLGKIRDSSRRDRRMLSFYSMSVAMLGWIITNAFTVVVDPGYFEFMTTVKMIFVCIIPYVSAWFIINFSESKLAKSSLIRTLLIAIPSIDILVLLTNPLHYLYYVTNDYPAPVIGPLWMVHLVLAVITLVFMSVLLIRHIAKNIHRSPLLLLAGISIMLPFILNMFYSFNLGGMIYDISPLGFFITVVFFYYYINISGSDHVSKLNRALAEISELPEIAFSHPEDAAALLAAKGCIALEADRVGIWRISDDFDRLISLVSYDSNKDECTVDEDLDISECTQYKVLLQTERLIVTNDARLPNPLTPVLGTYHPGICSFLDAPIRISGKLVGVVCVEQNKNIQYPHKRTWTIDEQNFASSLADFMALTISSAEQRRLEAAELASRAKSEFLARMSHEIRTPMSAVLGMTDLAIRSFPKETTVEYLTNIKTAGNQLLTIINDVLDISKVEAGAVTLVQEKYSIHSMIHDIVMMINVRASEKALHFTVQDDPDLPAEMIGDETRIKQVIINLLTNAVKFTEKGSILLSISAAKAKKSKEYKLKVSVEDTGIGIHEEDIDYLFDSFTQFDTRMNKGILGTGLGLAITKNLVELMGGEVYVESEYGKGSCFSFYVMQKVEDETPLSELTAEEKRKAWALQKSDEEQSELRLKDVRFLVVDDIEINLIIAEEALLRYGGSVDAADCGAKAIDLVKANEYDMVFMDHMMPELDGIDVTRIVRAMDNGKYKSLPIVALTANVVGDVREKFFDSGMNDFLSKPMEDREVERVLREWLPKEKIIN